MKKQLKLLSLFVMGYFSLFAFASFPGKGVKIPSSEAVVVQGEDLKNSEMVSLIFKGIKNGRIVSLTFDHVYMSDYFVDRFIDALEGNTSLHVLCLSDCKVTGDSICQFGILRELRLEELCLINLSQGKAGEAVVDCATEVLKESKTLKKLCLRGNGIKDMQKFSEALKENDHLCELDLSDNEIGDNGLIYISKALVTNSHLTRLNLIRNYIGNINMGYIARVLRKNSTLQELLLHENAIDDIGMIPILSALHENTTLRILGISRTNVTVGKAGEIWRARPDLRLL